MEPSSKPRGPLPTVALALALAAGLTACDAGPDGAGPDRAGLRAETRQAPRRTLEDLADRRAQARRMAGARAGAQGRWKGKAEVCHRASPGDAPYVRLEVPAPAVDAHLGHGDGLVGGGVPDRPGYTFGDDCSVVEAAVTCPCFGAEDVDLARAFNADWLSFRDTEYVRGGDEYRTVWLDNDAQPGGVWYFIVERVNETHRCYYGVPTLELSAYEDDITVHEAEACRLVLYDDLEEHGGTCEYDPYDPQNSCGVPFTEGVPLARATPLAPLQR